MAFVCAPETCRTGSKAPCNPMTRAFDGAHDVGNRPVVAPMFFFRSPFFRRVRQVT